MEKALPISFGKRTLAVATSAALALSLCAIPAQEAHAVEAKDVSGYVSGSATPMRVADPQILGISTVDERWSIEDGVTYDELTNTSGGLRYLLMGTDEYNENPDPYIYNTVYETDGTKIIQDSTRSGYTSSQAMRALAPYGLYDSDDAIWNMLPDVIIGTMKDNNETTDYSTEARGVEAALSLEAGSYNPIGVANNQQDTLGVLYRAAEAGNQAASTTGKELRYGDAVELVKNYEKYVKGSQGYVLKRLEQDGAQKKTVAYITANDGSTVTLATGAGDPGWDHLGAVTEVANNFADTLSTDESVSISISELEGYADQIDLIILATDDNYGEGFVSTTGLEGVLDRTYWTLDQDCGGICADNRGVDYARNYGLLLGCLYPEYIDQSDWIAYYYDTVYHVKDNMLSTAIDKAMDGVRNWDVTSGDASAYVQWSADSVSDYSSSEVASLMDEGCAYIASKGSAVSSNLALSDYIADEYESAVSFTDVSTSDWFYGTVMQAVELGYMHGDADDQGPTGTFRPNSTITRAETATVLWNMAGNPDPSGDPDYSDVFVSDWYADAVAWAQQEGVIAGYGGTDQFGPNDPVTREQVATMLWRQAGEPASAASLDGYSDGAETSSWAIDAMRWAVETGVLQGNAGELRPTADISRAELATVMVRL